MAFGSDTHLDTSRQSVKEPEECSNTFATEMTLLHGDNVYAQASDGSIGLKKVSYYNSRYS